MHPAIAQHRPGIAAIASATAFVGWRCLARRRGPLTLTRPTATPTFWWSLRRALSPAHTISGAKADLEALLGRGWICGAWRGAQPYVLDGINQQRAIIFSAELAIVLVVLAQSL